MSKLRLMEEQSEIQPTVVQPPIIEPSKFVTTEQLESTMHTIVDRLAKKIEPDSALTPEVRGVVKAVGEIQGLREALQSPASAGIEEATSTLVTNVLGNALGNIAGGGQQQAQPAPLRNTLAQIAVSNLTGENSPLPQLLDALTNVLGKDKVREGYDAGVQYIDKQQKQNDLPAFVLQLDENSQENVVAYAQQMGYSDVQYAQTRLIEHKNMLHQEIEEYQRIQSGDQQRVATEEPIVQQEPAREELVRQEPIVQQEQYSQAEYVEEPIVEEPIVEEPIVEEPIVEEPVLSIRKVVVLHSKPKKLRLVEEDDKKKSENDEFLDDVNDILNEIGE